ncbi:tyrosine-type recombinase/integrase [Paenibacillus sp. 2TAB23]|uniref:tyrosine-type recombinase/integrase n=1 Tax=Paenibacillus sp. 2TAB23 TaxID=3233004 RepID=UPI003F963381
MPLFDDAVKKEVELEQSLLQLADQYGADAFNRMLLSLLPPKENEITKRLEEIPLDDAINHYVSSDAYLSLATSSQQTYRYEMNLFAQHCKPLNNGFPSLNDINSSVLLINYCAQARSLNTQNKKKSFLSSFLTEVFSYFLNRDIGKLKRALTIENDRNSEPKAFTKEQIDEILINVRLGREAHRNFTILWTFLGSGIRLDEMIKLQVSDIVTSRQEIMVRRKGKKGLKQPNKITISALEVLNAYINFRYQGIKETKDYSDRYVFSDDKGISPLHASTVQKMFSSLIREIKSIPDSDKRPYQNSIHSLRHSFALYLLESGVKIYTIKDLMGHTWVSSTEKYLKIFDSELVKAINKHPFAQLKVSDLF